MTDPEMDSRIETLAGEPLDAEDARALNAFATLYEQVDPMPGDLIERVSFGLALDEVFAEVARITRDAAKEVGARSDATAVPDVTTTLTFTSQRLTAMLTITDLGRGQVRVDGWLDPAEPLLVRVRQGTGVEETVAGPTGRFVFEPLPRGFVQLSFRDPDDPDTVLVVTPGFEL
jgi:hypothetical protein